MHNAIEELPNFKPWRTRYESVNYKTKLIARLVPQQKGKIHWPIFQLAELVFFRAST